MLGHDEKSGPIALKSLRNRFLILRFSKLVKISLGVILESTFYTNVDENTRFVNSVVIAITFQT